MVIIVPPKFISTTSLTLSFLLLTVVQTNSAVSQSTTHHSKKPTSPNGSDSTTSIAPGDLTSATLPRTTETTTTATGTASTGATATTPAPSWMTATTSTLSPTVTGTSSTTTTTTTSIAWNTATPDSSPVVKLSIEDKNNQFGVSDFSFRLNTMKLFHECLCSQQNKLCEIFPQNVVKNVSLSINASQHVKLTNTYKCSYLVTKLSCSRASETDAAALCIHSNACVPDFTAFGPGCQLGLVNVEWNNDQRLTVGLWKNEVNSFLTCNASCSADSQGKGDDDGDEDDDDDDPVSPVVIGVVVAVGVVIFIIFMTLIAIMVRSRRRKAAQEARIHRMSEQGSTNSTISESVYASLDDNITTDRAPNNGYLIPNFGGEKHAKYDANSDDHRQQQQQDSTYAYIDGPSTSAGTKNEYSSLDEAFQYRHVYKRASQLPTDPRLRPPLPLPKKTTSDPLPYYSVANSFGTGGPDADAVSGQYLELIGEGPPPPTTTSDSGCDGHGDNGQSDSKAVDTTAIKNSAEYFELEKQC